MIWKSDNKPSDLNGFLDTGSHVHGELRFDASFRVDGKFTGSVSSEGDLIVGEGGEVEGELSVGQIFVSGTVRGSVRASKRIQISPSGKVYAEIDTPSLVIEDGAFFEGQCSMRRDEVRAAIGPKLVAAKTAG
jgi:cytoskeletal protein CcmA (bactofilin family)